MSNNILAKVIYGPNLYGTAIETSDLDFRCVYLPEIRDCILGTVKDAWEDKTGKEDMSYFSLQHFLSLASQGQSIAIEMLCAPADKVMTSTYYWRELQKNRKRFFTKNMHSFLGYAKCQSSKYSARIDRLNETEEVIKVLDYYVDSPDKSEQHFYKLHEIWDMLPTSLNVEKTINERNNHLDKRIYKVCGKELQATVTIAHALSVVHKISDSYGERVRNAKNGNIEWKALAHAHRAALQVKEIALTGDLVFPLKDAEYLRDMRLGKFNFLDCSLDKRLDDLIAETQMLIDNSSLPDKVDKEWVDNFILDVYYDEMDGFIRI